MTSRSIKTFPLIIPSERLITLPFSTFHPSFNSVLVINSRDNFKPFTFWHQKQPESSKKRLFEKVLNYFFFGKCLKNSENTPKKKLNQKKRQLKFYESTKIPQFEKWKSAINSRQTYWKSRSPEKLMCSEIKNCIMKIP